MLQQAPKPIATFRTEAVAFKDKDGITQYKNVHFVDVQQAGSKDSVTKIAPDWIADLANKATVKGDFDPQAEHYAEWHTYFKARYDAYVANLEMPMEGTPIKMCLSFSPAERAQCEHVKVFTLEQLAQCPEDVIQRLGMGGRVLKNKAAKMLESQAGANLAEQVAALLLKVDEQAQQITEFKAMLLAEGKDPDAPPVDIGAQVAAAIAAQFAAMNEKKKPGRPAKQ